jgi:Beta-propeller repeat
MLSASHLFLIFESIQVAAVTSWSLVSLMVYLHSVREWFQISAPFSTLTFPHFVTDLRPRCGTALASEPGLMSKVVKLLNLLLPTAVNSSNTARQERSMHTHTHISISSFLLGIAIAFNPSHTSTRLPGGARVPAPDATHAAQPWGRLPLAFEENRGQVDSQVKFLARRPGYTLFLTSDGAVVASDCIQPVRTSQKISRKTDEGTAVLRMKLIGANRESKVVGKQALPGTSNYFIGTDPRRWTKNVPQYAKVHYSDVYPGVDLTYYGSERDRDLEFDFSVAPGADSTAIRLHIDGAQEIRLDHGNVLMLTGSGEIRLRPPLIYQDVDGTRKQIAGKYVLSARDEISLQVAPYDHQRALVVDPVLAYATYLGGADYFGQDIQQIAVNAAGEAYVVGQTNSPTFPLANAIQPILHGGTDVFVTKINADGTGLVYSTFLGGSDYESGAGIAIDATGNAYITGTTLSTDFPTVGTIQTKNGGTADAFAAKISADGNTLLYSAYLGGNNYDQAWRIAVDRYGAAYILGNTLSTNFPTKSAFQPNNGGGQDVFVTKINAAGKYIAYSTYLGGSAEDVPADIKVDAAGRAYVTGNTLSTDFPTQNAIQSGNAGGRDGFVTKLGATGSVVLFSTYWGASADDSGGAIALDSQSNIYLAGNTLSVDFPTINPLQPSNAGKWDCFLSKINASGTTVLYSTYLGGNGIEGCSGIALDTEKEYLRGWRNGLHQFPGVERNPEYESRGSRHIRQQTESVGQRAPLFDIFRGHGQRLCRFAGHRSGRQCLLHDIRQFPKLSGNCGRIPAHMERENYRRSCENRSSDFPFGLADRSRLRRRPRWHLQPRQESLPHKRRNDAHHNQQNLFFGAECGRVLPDKYLWKCAGTRCQMQNLTHLHTRGRWEKTGRIGDRRLGPGHTACNRSDRHGNLAI